MNVDTQYVEMYKPIFENNTNLLKRLGSMTEYFLATDTLQFDDCSKFQVGQFNERAKQQRHEEWFPQDL